MEFSAGGRELIVTPCPVPSPARWQPAALSHNSLFLPTHPPIIIQALKRSLHKYKSSLGHRFLPSLCSILECHALISGTVFTQLMTHDLSFGCTLSITPQHGLEAVQNPSCLAWQARCFAVRGAVGRLQDNHARI